MFRRVIPRIVQNVSILKSNSMCTAPEATRLEKTLNEVSLLGRVGHDPKSRGNSNHPLVVFSLATHNNYKDTSGEFMQKTDWHRICIFKPSLRNVVMNYLKKGQRVLVTGKITYGEFEDEAGNIKTSTAIIANDVIFFQNKAT